MSDRGNKDQRGLAIKRRSAPEEHVRKRVLEKGEICNLMERAPLLFTSEKDCETRSRVRWKGGKKKGGGCRFGKKNAD